MVTGASRRIGQNFARATAERGYGMVARVALRFVWRRRTYVPYHADFELLVFPAATTTAGGTRSVGLHSPATPDGPDGAARSDALLQPPRPVRPRGLTT